MRWAITTLALTLSLAGCGSEVPFPMSADVFYVGGDKCPASTFLVGVLVIDDGRLAIQDDEGALTRLTWRAVNRARQLPGGEVEVMDGWTVVATTGRRYAIGGGYEAAFGGFWACADVVPA